MLFVSMCDDVKAGLFERNRGNSFGFRITEEMVSGSPVAGGLILNGKEVTWGEGSNMAEYGLGVVEGATEYEKGISFEGVKDTEENPILFILCNEIGIYNNIMADIKVFRLDSDHLLVALISGACEFNGVPLQRCNNSNLDNAKIGRVMRDDSLFGEGTFLGKGKDISINYSYDAICHGQFTIKNDGAFNSRSVRSREYIFDDTNKARGEERIRRQEEQKKKEAEALQARREAQKAEYEKQKAEKERKEREKREAEIDLKLSGVKVTKDTKVMNVGAADFLKAVAMQS